MMLSPQEIQTITDIILMKICLLIVKASSIGLLIIVSIMFVYFLWNYFKETSKSKWGDKCRFLEKIIQSRKFFIR